MIIREIRVKNKIIKNKNSEIHTVFRKRCHYIFPITSSNTAAERLENELVFDRVRGKKNRVAPFSGHGVYNCLPIFY